jgi:hypothetical protein
MSLSGTQEMSIKFDGIPGIFPINNTLQSAWEKVPYRRLHTNNSAACFRLLTRVRAPISKKQSSQQPSSRLNPTIQRLG